MKNYQKLLRKILDKGNIRDDRTGVGTISLFGEQLVFRNIEKNFPLLTTKKMFTKGIIMEMLWMLRGDTNTKFLKENGVTIWDEWANKDGDLGPIYGYQWRNFNGEGIDQITNVIKSITENPKSRRHIVITYNPAQVDKMAIPPCPTMFQFYVQGSKLSMHLYQRSADIFLGVPFDIAVYALLLKCIAQVCNLKADKLIVSYGDVHIYKNHIDQVNEQLSREPFKKPYIKLNKKIKNIFDFTFEDFKLVKYTSHEAIKAPIAV